MKQIITIPVHSFVDLITNSSSELFVISGQKKIETIKEVIKSLYKIYLETNEDADQSDKQIKEKDLFVHIFQEPYEVTWDFDPTDPLIDKFLKKWGDLRYFYIHERYFGAPESNVCTEVSKFKKHYAKLQQQYAEYFEPQSHYTSMHYLKDGKGKSSSYRSTLKKIEKLIKQLHEEAESRYQIDRNELIIRLSAKHKVTTDEITKIFELSETISQYSKRRPLMKHTVVLWSKSDNSVPCKFIGMIQNTLSCERFHIG